MAKYDLLSIHLFVSRMKRLKYKLHVYTLLGGIHSIAFYNGFLFTTKDVDNDVREYDNCAGSQRGGFWYKGCRHFFPNGLYQSQETVPSFKGIIWKNNWLTSEDSLEWIECMIRMR